MKFLAIVVGFALSASVAQQSQTAGRPAASQTERMYQAAADSAERKLRHIEQNAKRTPPDQTPTVLMEREINAYLNSGRVELPKGVQKVTLSGRNGFVEGTARVDFDAVMESRRTSNPLLVLFSGVHDVHARVRAQGRAGEGFVDIQSVDIDGTRVPQIALEFFISHYLTPKYPNVGMESRFELPDKIDTASVGERQLTITQK